MTGQYRDEVPDGIHEIPPVAENEEDIESQDPAAGIESQPSASSRYSAVPVWLQESAATFRFRKVPLPLRKSARALVNWVKGPIPPQELKITPLFSTVQEFPIRILDRYAPKRRHRVCLLIAFYAIWFLVWSLMLKQLSTAGYIEGYGRPENLWCGASFWESGNGCGLNGDGCRPFSAANIAFRCPANCDRTHILEGRVVGNASYVYQGLVVGGPSASGVDKPAVYRGDSFTCQAAIHAGIIRADVGGCGIVSLLGEYSGFDASRHHGIQSIPFPSTFPRTFYFPDPSEYDANCPPDSRWGIFAVTAAALVILSLFTTSPATFFFSAFVILFFHVGLVSDPPNLPNFYELLSSLCGRLLPASFITYVLYLSSARPLLRGLTAQVEKTVLYLGMCFIGALNNYTFAPLIPISRLTPADLAQPGAKLALSIVITVIILIVLTQIFWIRLSGKMPKYLAIYGTMVVSLVILLVLPGQRLRIHHYILALLFMPGTAFQVRPSLAYQGLLLGFFINGVARWGFASIIQTPAALGESGGGNGGSWWGATSPNVTAIVAPNSANITFKWGGLPPDTGIDGVSILVNDVERWRGHTDRELWWDSTQSTLKRQPRWEEHPEPEFYRFAWMHGGSTGRYGNAGVWDENGSWQPIPNGQPPKEGDGAQ